VARTGKTEPVSVCLDADVLIACLLSRTGASHAILILAEIGLLTLVLPEAVIEEVRCNLSAKLPEALPLFQEFLRSVPARVYRPTAQDRERARALANPKDVPIPASAIGSGAPLLMTHSEGKNSDARCREPRADLRHGNIEYLRKLAVQD
jgi:predicted nucleic acid-binding protein